jgi:hypothetical protein
MYKDRMVYKLGDLVRVGFLNRTSKHNIGLIVSINENSTIYGVKFGIHVQKFHHSFIQHVKGGIDERTK